MTLCKKFSQIKVMLWQITTKNFFEHSLRQEVIQRKQTITSIMILVHKSPKFQSLAILLVLLGVATNRHISFWCVAASSSEKDHKKQIRRTSTNKVTIGGGLALKHSNKKEITSSASLSTMTTTAATNDKRKTKKKKSKKNKMYYEVWGSDQSNTVTGETSAGVNGSFLWIWDSDSIHA